jgi:membrane fusion protein, multidrug efflux system
VTPLLRTRWLPLLLFPCAVLLGCNPPGGPQGPGNKAPDVLVSVPVSDTVTDYEDFPGRTEAVYSIELRARVTGYLDRAYLKEGADVQKGQVLFRIDPRPYQAELNRAEANLTQANARSKRLNADYARARLLYGKGTIGREEFDKIAGDRAEAEAGIGVAEAALEMARLNLDFTNVTSPITGKVSRRYVDPGNLVKADDTVLTTVVSLDPMYAYFDLDERTTLGLKRLIREGKVKWSADSGLPVFIALADENLDTLIRQKKALKGTINFADNRVDPDTGTWRLRGRFDNKNGALTPGLFVHVRLYVGLPYKATLVAEQAVSTDQGQKFVYVVEGGQKTRDKLKEVDPNGKDVERPVDSFEGATARYRRVTVGRQHGGLRVITGGLGPDEMVVVSGLQRVRDKEKVNAKLVKMPVLAPKTPTADVPRLGPQGGKPAPRESSPIGPKK